MRSLRTRIISTRVTDEEYGQLVALAGSHTVSAWMHDALLTVVASPHTAILLAELIALRTILLNLHNAVFTDTPLTPDALQQIIARVDADKLRKAQERLATIGPRRPQP